MAEFDEQKYHRQVIVEKNAKRLVQELTDFVNYTSRSEYGVFVQELARQHRTLQQASTKLMLVWLAYCASEDYRTDGRNEATKALAQEIQAKLEFPLDTYLPMI